MPFYYILVTVLMAYVQITFIILNMTANIRSKTFKNRSKARYHFYLSFHHHIICESNPLASCAELFEARPSVFVINRQIKYHCK